MTAGGPGFSAFGVWSPGRRVTLAPSIGLPLSSVTIPWSRPIPFHSWANSRALDSSSRTASNAVWLRRESMRGLLPGIFRMGVPPAGQGSRGARARRSRPPGGRRAARAKSTWEAGKKKPPGRPGGWEEAKRRLRAAPRLLEAEPSAEAEDPRAQGFVDEADAVRGGVGAPGASDTLQDEGLVEQVEAVHAQGQTEVLESELLLEAAVDVDDVVEPVGVR